MLGVINEYFKERGRGCSWPDYISGLHAIVAMPKHNHSFIAYTK